MLTPGDRQLLGQAFGLWQGGRINEALAIARGVDARSPLASEPLHLIALCLRSLGDDAAAAMAFGRALQRAPDDVGLLGDCADHLRRVGRSREALDLYRRVVHLRPGAVRALQGLGSVARSLGDLESAEAACRQVVALEPANGAAWINLAVVRRLQGDPVEALACLDRSVAAGFKGPELLDVRASALLDLGDPSSALLTARSLVSNAPAYVPGQVMLAHLLWEHGDGPVPAEEARAALRTAVAAQPGNRPLRRAYLNFLLECAAGSEALEQVRELQAMSDEPDLMVVEAQALELLGDMESAAQRFDQAYPALRGQAAFLTLLARHLLARRDPQASAARSLEAIALEPCNQIALAYLGVAWRLTGDPREDWLCGYDRLPAVVDIPPPDGYPDQQAFLADLEIVLTGLHTARREPVNQSLRGGSQTSGNLFGRREPQLVAAREAMARALRAYIAGLADDATHPFLGRKSMRSRFAGSWSVRLHSAGRHINHFHQQGWISSAFYVRLPPVVRAASAADTAGFLQFGEPPPELATGLAPRRLVHPRPGQLVLFPSYLWHGTLPFVDPEPRLTVAFDVLPA